MTDNDKKYSEALNKIHSLLQFGSRPGLDRIFKLLEKINNPQESLKFIHVAGTNGKGSVCAVLSSVLSQANYKTGLFISPYITDFCERIQINNTPISHALLCEAVDYIFPIVKLMEQDGDIITEFEFITAVAFYCFKKEGCDIVVLETGLGGLLDSTNTVKNTVCSVITSISLDHTAILGDTLEDIAYQKCGIIKDNSITVTSPQKECVLDTIKMIAKEKNNEIYFANDIKIDVISSSLDKTELSYGGLALDLHLLGEHQVDNAKTSLCTLLALKKNNVVTFSDTELQKGFLNALNPARFEVLCKKPVIVLDGAHNPDGVLSFKSGVENYSDNGKKILIIGMLKDKDSDSAIISLKGLFDKVFTVPVDNPRTDTAESLKNKFLAVCSDTTAFENPYVAIDNALVLLKDNNTSLFICGSLYLAGEIRPYLLDKIKELYK